MRIVLWQLNDIIILYRFTLRKTQITRQMFNYQKLNVSELVHGFPIIIAILLQIYLIFKSFLFNYFLKKLFYSNVFQ